MKLTVADLLDVMETLAPRHLAADWDNVGLQIGDPRQPVRRLRVALDPLPEVVAAACRERVDLLITHHPLIFHPLTRIDVSTPLGAALQQALTHRLAVVAAHTNLDSAAGGINDYLARRLGLTRLTALCPFSPAEPFLGLGRVGYLPHATRLAPLALDVKERLGLRRVTLAGDPDLPVTCVALCSGSGGSLVSDYLRSPAQVFISGDLRYHDARTVEQAGRGLLDIGHFASEHLYVTVLGERLSEALRERRADIQVEVCGDEADPFETV